MKLFGCWILLVVCLGGVGFGCGEGSQEEGEGESGIVVEKELQLAVYESRVLTLDGALVGESEVAWRSEDAEVAAVDGDGRVVGVGEGKTKIVVVAGGKKASVAVTVRALAYRSVAVAREHSCAVTWSGDVYCWGSNESSQLERNDLGPTSVPVKVYFPEAMASVALGQHHSCALSQAGEAYCWGYNDFMQVGVAGTHGMVVISTPLRGQRFQSLVASDFHTCGLTVEGELYCWGDNTVGSLGMPGVAGSQIPQKVAFDGEITQVVAGVYNTCVLDVEGAAYCSGYNGGAILTPFAGQMSFSPVRVGGDALFTSLALGIYTVCGLTVEGTTLCWGENLALGRGRTQVEGPAASPIDSDERFEVLAGGTYAFCGLNGEGQLHCWGSNGFGSLGDMATDERLPGPVGGERRFSRVAVGDAHICGVELDGSLWCWGYNSFGQLGDGRTMVHSKPVRAAGETLRLREMVSSHAGTCGRAVDSGKYYCWGYNLYQQFGPLEVEGYHAYQPTLAQYPERQWQQLGVGYGHSCGLTLQGEVFCWGTNRTGQLGNGFSEENIFGVAPVASSVVFGSIYVHDNHSCGLTRDGKAYCWGSNESSQLGANHSIQSVKPVEVATNLRFSELALGTSHSCGLTTTGAVYCWGGNHLGELGTMRAPAVSQTPVSVPLRARITSLKSGANHACGLEASGVLHCWGHNAFGELGDGSYYQAPGPVQVPGNWQDFDIGSWTTCARNFGDELYCWGWNTSRQVSSEVITGVNTPQLMDVGFAVGAYSVGGTFVCVLDAEGHPYCWGRSGVGQLGIESTYYLSSPGRVVGGEF